MPGHVYDVVRAAHYPEVAILILVTCIRGLVIAGIGAEIGILKSFIVIPQRRKTTGWNRKFDSDVANLTCWQLLTTIAQHAYIIAWDRLCAGPWLHRKHPQANAIGSNRPARFRLPPVINDRHTELPFCPQERVRVAPLTRKEERAKAAQVILADVFAVGVFAPDRPKSRWCRKKNSHLMLRDHPPERAGVRSADGFTLVKNSSVPVE